MADPDAPWWSAGDDEFAGATPLFDGAADGTDSGTSGGAEDGRTGGASDGTTADGPTGGAPGADGQQVGTAIGEALKFAAALSTWSEQSGLSDTLKALAAEAAAALSESAAEAPAATAPVIDEHTTVVVCDYCPVCRGMEVVRQVQPHLAQGLAEAMSSLTQALNLAVDSFAAAQQRSGR